MIMENVTWPAEQDKADNLQAIKNLYGDIDFMLNEHTYTKGDDKSR
jgi:hypothetical protein